MDFDFPTFNDQDGFDATTRAIGMIQAIQKLSDAEAEAQANFLHALLADVICKQFLPAAANRLFDFSLTYIPLADSSDKWHARISIKANCVLPTFHACRHNL